MLLRYMNLRQRRVRMLLSLLIVLSFTNVSRAQAVNELLITMLDYSYNCSTGMATVKYHITNYDAQGHIGGYGTSYTINLGVYSTSGYINNGDDDLEFTGGYIIGDLIECRAWGAGNNFTYPLSFGYIGYLPKPAAPQIWLLSPVQICNNETVTITASGSNGNYLWSNGQTGESITVSAAGTYTVQAVGSCGNSDPSNAIVVVANNAPSPPVVTNNGTSSLCNGETTTLSASSTVGTINWSNGATGSSITVNSSGNYSATETNGCGTSSASNIITISTGSLPTTPVITPGGFPFLCDGISATLQIIGGANANWYKDGVLIGSGSPNQSVNLPGTYTATVSNACGSSGISEPVVITTGVTPATPVISSSAGTLLCNGGASILSTTPTNGGSIRWSTGVWGNSISVTEPGTYYAYEVNSCGGSPNSNSIVITTGNTLAPPVILPDGPLEICNGASVALSVPGGGNINWYKDGGLLATNSGTQSINAPGRYSATISNGCGMSSESVSVFVSSGGSPSAPSISSSANIICNGTPVTLTASGSGTIHWNNGSTGSNINVSTAGSYYAYAVNSCGTSGNSNTVLLTSGITPPAPVLNVSGSIILCDGAGQLVYTNPVAGGVIRWGYGLIGNSITFYDPGSYYAYESNGCGNGPSSSFAIGTMAKPAAPVVTPPGSQLLCNGQTATLTSSGSSITWNNGTTGKTLVTGVAGTYYAYATNYCGNSPNSNSVVITTGNCPMPSPGTSFFICPGALKTLDAGAGYDTYLWSNGATTRSIAVGPGNYAVTVSKNGCYETSVTVTVSYYAVSIPAINASGPLVFCAGNSVTLSSSPASAYVWSNGATSNSINVTGSGSFYVTVTDGNGCQATSAATTVTVNPLPSASISGTSTVCKNSASPYVTFNASGGTAPYTFSYNINGGSTQTITTSTNSISVAVPTGSAGTYFYNLLGVQESSSTACYNPASGSATVTVRDLPTAVIDGSATVCLNSGSPLVNFTGGTGSAPYVFTYSINGGAAQTVTTVSGNSVSVSVPTNVAGTFTYSLISVQESSGLACANAVSGSATIVVRPLPNAAVGGSTTVCQNSTNPFITFTGSVGTAPYVFTYNINGGAAQTVTTVSGNAVSVSVPTNNAGVFTYNLISVQESGTGSCSNIASGLASVVVNPLPAASIDGSVTVCQNSSQPSVTFTGSNSTAPYTFTYKINGGSNQTVSTVSGNSVSVNVPTDVAGTFVYELVSVQESSGVSCINTASGSATIVVRPLPTASIGGTTAVCMNSERPLVTFTGSIGNAPYTFTYNINGGSNQTITTTTGNSVSVEAPTNFVGTFVYNLVGVQESGSPSCLNVASGSVTIVVNPLPAASIVGSVTVCQNDAAPLITFTGSNATAPYTFTYQINGGTNQTVSTASGNSVTVAVPTNVAGVFTYSLLSVVESSGTACANIASGSAIVVINPQPTSAVLLSPNTHLCNGETGQLTIYNWTEGFTYTWYKDGVLLTTSSAQTMTITQAGSYTVLATSNLGCNAPTISNAVVITVGSISAPIITGKLKVCEGGQTKLVISPSDKGKPYELYRWTDTPIGDTVAWDKNFSAFAGQYEIRVYRDGCFDSASVTVTSNDTEFPAGELKVFPMKIPYGGQATFMADVSGADHYEWDFGDSRKAVTFSNRMQQNYFTRNDSVVVRVRAVSERNCITEFESVVRVGKPDTSVLTDHSWAGNLKDWNVFPVPFRDLLKLSVILKRSEMVKVDLFTADGSWVRSWSFKGAKGENLFVLDQLSGLSAGVMYFITGVYNGEKHIDKIYKY